MKSTGADLLRNKLIKTQISKKAEESKHPKFNEVGGIDDIHEEVINKMYNPLFKTLKYKELGVKNPKTVLLYGISGVGKKYLLNSFCSQFNIPLLKFTKLESDIEVRELFRKCNLLERPSIIMIDHSNILQDNVNISGGENNNGDNNNSSDDSDNLKIVRQIKESIERMDWDCLIVFIHKNKFIKFEYDSEIFLKVPNFKDRKQILIRLLNGVNVEEDLDVDFVAYNTPGFVPRDLVRLLMLVGEKAITRSVKIDEGKGIGRSNSNRNNPNNNFNNNNNNSNNYNTGSKNSLNYEFDKPVIKSFDFKNSLKDWRNIQQIITFDDIGALKNVKEELEMSILLPAKFPEKFKRFGIDKPSGILLYGPPGCGKTLIAKAVASMSHCSFLSIKGPELITKYVGDSEKHLRNLFEKARNLSPCILFFDEIDSLCGKRGKNEFGNRIVNQILTLLDGVDDRGKVYIIGATNRINSIDLALLRPGRFDKMIEVPLPSKEDCVEIFEKCIKNIPVESGLNYKLESDLFGLSGAGIAGVVKEACTICLKENFNNDENALILERHFIEAINKSKTMNNFRQEE